MSLLGSNFASVGVLWATAVSTNGSFEPGTDLGMMRYVPSVSWSMRQSCSGLPVNFGTATTSASAVAASARSVPAIVILKYGAPG